MTIELKPEQERILLEAVRLGRFSSVEQALDGALHAIEGPYPEALSPPERTAAFRAWAANHPHHSTFLSDEAISRESIYSDRG